MTSIVARVTVADRQVWASRQFGRVVHSTGSVFRAARTAWNNFAAAGQMGPVSERSIGRHTGARI